MAWLRDRFLWGLAKLIVAGMFDDLEIDGKTRPDSDRPTLVVSNHLNGLVDVIAVIVAIGHYPRFVARASLFRRRPLRWVMRAVGAIPIYRAQRDGEVANGMPHDNQSSFREIHKALAKGRTVAVFPEGRVSDDERLQPIRTGAARMVLGAVGAGVESIEIVPIGITYVDKATTRSRVLVRFGEVIDLSTVLAQVTEGRPPSEDDRPAVHSLTDLLRERLALLAPSFGSLAREARLFKVADLVLRSDLEKPFSEPLIADTMELAERIARLPLTTQDQIFDAVGRYHLELSATGLRDDQIAPTARLRDLVRTLTRSTLRLVIALPLAIVGLATNILPILLVIAVGTAIREPVTKGTARMVTALVTFPAAWAFALWSSGRTGWQLALWVGILVAGSVLLIIAVASMIDFVDAGISWRQVSNRRALVQKVLQLRYETVAYVTDVLG
ncbi:MAG: 1-acyl-sn-glycerol-3-phosphate acyltransferase [Acidimicrobiia bacterium]|nr:1-acyl-sn-glycerol-3-phosphate acyltransferase [Acidimicrobiia bacterium]